MRGPRRQRRTDSARTRRRGHDRPRRDRRERRRARRQLPGRSLRADQGRTRARLPGAWLRPGRCAAPLGEPRKPASRSWTTAWTVARRVPTTRRGLANSRGAPPRAQPRRRRSPSTRQWAARCAPNCRGRPGRRRWRRRSHLGAPAPAPACCWRGRAPRSTAGRCEIAAPRMRRPTGHLRRAPPRWPSGRRRRPRDRPPDRGGASVRGARADRRPAWRPPDADRRNSRPTPAHRVRH